MNPTMAATMRSELRRVIGGSAIYALPPLIARGLGLLTVPLYTIAVTPAEYGVMTLAVSLTPVVSTVIGLGVHMATARLHFDHRGDREAALHGTVLSLLVVVPAAATGGLLLIGSLGGLEIFETLRFRPHLVPVLLTSFFLCLCNLPVNVFMAREQPRPSALFGALQPMLAAVFGVALVVLAGWGVEGYLWAHCSARRHRRDRVRCDRRPPVRISLAVADGDTGTGVRCAAGSASPVDLGPLRFGPRGSRAIRYESRPRSVWGRLLVRDDLLVSRGCHRSRVLPDVHTEAEERRASRRRGAYRLLHPGDPHLGLSWHAVLAPDFIRLVTTAPFHGAAELVPILVLGLAFGQLSQLWTKSIYLEKRTRSLGVATTAAAALNIGLNFWLIPLYGVVAAAWTTVAAYAFQSVVHGWIAQTPRIRWEYGRWLHVSVVAGLVFVGSILLRGQDWVAVVSRGALCALGFPVLLVASRFFRSDERRAGRAFLRRRTGGA